MPADTYQSEPTTEKSDYYGDTPEESGATEGESQQKPEEAGGEPTAVLPKSILAGKEFKPGDEVVLRIDAIHDDEVVVSYAPKKEGGSAEAGTPNAAKGEMTSMFED